MAFSTERGGESDDTGRMHLYSGPLSMFGAKAEIAAREKGLDFELVMVPFDMQRLYEPKHPEVLRINPKRQVPVLVHGDLEIFDSTQIFEYLEDLRPEPPLWPRSRAERAQARLIEHKSDEVYFPPIIRLMGLQDKPQDQVAVAARDASARYYAEMEALLADGDYLGGPYTYADIAFYMAQLFGERMGARMTETTPMLLAWRDRMTSRPAVSKVVGAMAAYLVSQGKAFAGIPGTPRAAIRALEMKHATTSALDELEPLLAEIRRRAALKEKSRGVFYRGSRATLHFHEDPQGLFADLRLGADWRRLRVNTQAERAALLAELAGLSGT